MKSRSTRVGSVAGALALLVQGLAMMPANAAPDASLAWVQKDLALSASLGGVADAQVEVTYSGNVTNPGVKVVGALASAVTLDLSQATPTTAGRALVPLHIEMPATAQDDYNANIQLTIDGKPVPQPLHLNVTPKAVDPNVLPEASDFPAASRIADLEGAKVVSDQIVIHIADDDVNPTDTAKSVAATISGQIVSALNDERRYEIRVPGSTLDGTLALVDRVTTYTGVTSATIALLGSQESFTSDPVWSPSPSGNYDRNWNLQQIDVPGAWDTTNGGGIRVTVVDSGVDVRETDLAPKVSYYSNVAGSNMSHGTHVSGTICAQGNNNVGVVGVAYGCSLSMRGIYANKTGDLNMNDVFAKVREINKLAADTSPRVVNLSLGSWTDFDCTRSGLNRQQLADVAAVAENRATMVSLLKKRPDILWVFAAGNSGQDSSCTSYGSLGNRSDLPNVVTVASSTIGGTMWPNSVRGSGVTVAGPGGDATKGVWSTVPQACAYFFGNAFACSDNYGYKYGTSMAAPHVAGTAALAFAANDKLGAADAKKCLIAGAVAGGKALAGQGFSIINAKKTVECARGAQQAAPLTNVQTVAAGQSGTYALKKDGTVWAWGANYSGELGNGTTNSSAVPTPVSGLSGVSAIAAGAGDAYALKSDGSVWAWGTNDRGQIGDGTTINSSTPVRVPGLPTIASIATRGGAAFAVGTDGSAWAWGNNWLGQAGIGPDASASSPVRLAIPDAVKAIYPGGYTGYALTTKGTVWSWGDNGAGQLGNGTTTASNTPVPVTGLSSATRLFASNGSVVYAQMLDQTLKVWGEGSGGALGNGTYDNSSVPITVPYVAGVSQIAADPGHTFVRLGSGRVLAWGNGWMGALGTGTTDNTATPTPVSGISTATSIATAGRSSWALISDGTVRAWGAGFLGAMGNGTTADSNPTPVAVSGLSGVVSLIAGSDAAYAVKSDGTLWSWGANWGGQLGRPTTDSISATPGRV